MPPSAPASPHAGAEPETTLWRQARVATLAPGAGWGLIEHGALAAHLAAEALTADQRQDRLLAFGLERAAVAVHDGPPPGCGVALAA